jgi:hypothetical protein
MLNRTRILTAALAAVALAGGATGVAAAQASAPTVSATAAQAAAPIPRHLTIVLQRTAIAFFSTTGPITGWPTTPLVPGDRVIGQDRILQEGRPVGRDNEACTIAFTRDVLCQDIAVLPGRGDLQTSWTFRWPRSGTQGPPSYHGVIDGGTGIFAAADGTFRAQNQPNGECLTLTIGTGG